MRNALDKALMVLTPTFSPVSGCKANVIQELTAALSLVTLLV